MFSTSRRWNEGEGEGGRWRVRGGRKEETEKNE
jgi:hypothetical protein